MSNFYEQKWKNSTIIKSDGSPYAVTVTYVGNMRYSISVEKGFDCILFTREVAGHLKSIMEYAYVLASEWIVPGYNHGGMGKCW